MAIPTTTRKFDSYLGQSTIPDTSLKQGPKILPVNDAPQNNQPQNDKYKALETTSYKDLMSANIQASNAKDQALKYVQNSLNTAGLGNTGMAESTRLGIYNSYQNALNENQKTYNANLLDIGNQRIADQEDRWQSAMTMLDGASSQADLDYVRENFYDSFTDDQKKYFDYYYNSYSSEFTRGENYMPYATDLENKVSIADELNKLETLPSNIKKMADADEVITKLRNGEYENGSVYMGGNDEYYIIIDGYIYKTSKETYVNSNKRLN